MIYRKNLTNALNLRLTNADWGYLYAQAQSQGTSISEYIRALIQRDRIAKGDYAHEHTHHD